MLLPFKSENIKVVPEKSGVYLLYNKEKELVYIGKALNLKKRLLSYFKKGYSHGILFPESIDYFEYLVTKNEKEAFFVERDFIKSKSPKYNIKLKDDKNFLLLRIKVDEDFPYITTSRRKTDSASLYFGPFVPASFAYKILKTIGKIFKIRTCKEKMGKRKRPCLDYFLNLCSAPCVGKISKEDYRDSVNKAIDFLRGNIDYYTENLKKEMEKASKNLEFEKAAEIRDKVFAIETIKKITYKDSRIKKNYDIWGYKREKKQSLFLVLRTSENASLKEKREFFLNNVYIEDEELVFSVISEFYFKEKIPETLILNFNYTDDFKNNLLSFLNSRSGKKLKILKGRSKQFSPILKNIRENLEIKFNEYSKNNALKRMRVLLKLKNYPERIEAYDISHLSGTNIVGAKVLFFRGEPEKSGYRRYFISEKAKPDDPKNIYVLVKRRFSSKRDRERPDLLLIDGGINQLNMAKKALRELNIDIDIISISKGEKDIVHLDERAKIKDDGSNWFKILKKARDEAHRFAINYQRYKRKLW